MSQTNKTSTKGDQGEKNQVQKLLQIWDALKEHINKERF